jgi:hypothetical protein
MQLTASDAIALLKRSPQEYTTPETLRELAAQVSVAPFGGASSRQTVLYSGRIEEGEGGLDAWTLAKAIQAKDEGVAIIDASERGMFLGSRPFKEALVKAFASEGVLDYDDLCKKRGSKANQFVFDATQGLWADASKSFAESAEGDITTLTSLAPDNRTFALVELPALLANPKVKHVNGVDKAVLQEVASGPMGIKGLLKAVAETSRQLLERTTLARGQKGGIAAVDTTALLGHPQPVAEGQVPADALKSLKVGPPDTAILAELGQAVSRVQRRWLDRLRSILARR